jgi:hypothetical protein
MYILYIIYGVYIYNVCVRVSVSVWVCICTLVIHQHGWLPGIARFKWIKFNRNGAPVDCYVATLLQALFHLFPANEPSTSRSCSTTVPSPLPPPVRWEVAYPGEAMLPLVPGTTCMTWWFELSAHRCFLPGCGLRCGDVGWMEVWLNIGARNRM